jgi:hypothetical protein
MDSDFLVSRLVAAGRELLNDLDAGGIPIQDAFWLYDRETEHWRLHLATPLVETEGPLHVYKLLRSHLPVSGLIDSSDITLEGTRSGVVKDLRGAVRSNPVDITEQRLTRSAFNNIYIEDGYIYCVA